MKCTYLFEASAEIELTPARFHAQALKTSTGMDMVVECEISKPIPATWESPAEGSEVELTDIYIDGLDKDGETSYSYLWRDVPTKSGLHWLVSDEDLDLILEEIYEKIDHDNWGVGS